MGQSLSTSVPSPDLNISKTNRFCYGYGDGDGNDSSDNNFGYRRNYIDEIPDECLASILHFLDAGDRKSCSVVCQRWLRVEGESRQRLSLNAEAKLIDFVPSLFTRFDSVTKLALRCNRKSISINDDALILISLRFEALDGSGSDVGVQETTMAFVPNDDEVTLVDDSPSTSNNNNNNNNNRLFRTKFGFFAGRNFVPCAFRRWTNIDTISSNSFS
ncbi:hypothetical protein TSUD_157680 [Trifolium subterraneum]|uniref:COI1 F-box domain-containing protein n=1 Tax=Trifolium subterraneum TaxID=3900 RepID=A0A2Z6N853_TRISU|nr:hypothetical protein TSUD_157680 [Trifolium subterraneum]